MRILFTVLFIGLYMLTHAQSAAVVVGHYDSLGRPMADEVNSFYYRIDSAVGNQSASRSYYTKSGKPRHVSAFGENGNLKDETWYFNTGGLEAKGTFKYASAVGPLMMWYENGKPWAQLDVMQKANAFDYVEFRILEYWDSLGNKIVNEGNGSGRIDLGFTMVPHSGSGRVDNGYKEGVWTGGTKLGSYDETYKKGKLVQGVYSKEGKIYNYTQIEQIALPKEGMEGFYKQIAKIMNYPPKARRVRAQGKVFVEFVINEDGTVSDVKTRQGFHPACDAEAERVIKLSPPWNPGLQRGVPVKQRMVLPISFKIG